MRHLAAAFALVVTMAPVASAQTGPPVTYLVTFPAPEHHWLQVDVTFSGLGATPLRARMSRSSPGRYAVHEFAKNVFQLDAYDGRGRALHTTRPDADEWDVAGHDGTVRLVYKIFGDDADGTYLGVDTTHAHLNMPAAFLWAVGLEMRPMRIVFTPPPDSGWRVGTQLFPTSDPFAFTAPNLQYFMDSPTELAAFLVSTFSLPNASGSTARFRIVAHSDGGQADVDALATLVERLLREEMAIFGEFPAFETGQYTFLLDYVSWGEGDGMEHRNSTTISDPRLSLRTAEGRREALDAIAHEFFHTWNVERIRPAGIEPFDFTRENVTCCLWLAEGFTQYYGEIALRRAGLGDALPTSYVPAVINGSGREVRSAVQMSEYAPFADAGVAIDVRDASRTFISYYVYGAAIALGLDLSLRELSGGRLSLDDFMRRLWGVFGKPADARPGYVLRPYSLQDLRDQLAALTGNRGFANDFFDRYVEGREVVDYAHLLGLAGFVVRPSAPDRAWIGNVRVDPTNAGLLIGNGRDPQAPALVPFGTPAYDAGLDEGDVIVSIDNQRATLAVWAALAAKRPGERVTLAVRRRDGKVQTVAVTLKADPDVEVVPIETTGGRLTDAARAFREAWLGTKVP